MLPLTEEPVPTELIEQKGCGGKGVWATVHDPFVKGRGGVRRRESWVPCGFERSPVLHRVMRRTPSCETP